MPNLKNVVISDGGNPLKLAWFYGWAGQRFVWSFMIKKLSSVYSSFTSGVTMKLVRVNTDLCLATSPKNVYCWLLIDTCNTVQYYCNCEAQARVRQGSARDGCQGERPQSSNPCLELTLKLVATTTHHKFNFNQLMARWGSGGLGGGKGRCAGSLWVTPGPL